MAYISEIPVLNNIQFVPEDVVLPEKYHYLEIDRDWYKNTIRQWQYGRPYKQKIQLSDRQYIVLNREDANDVYFKIYDSNANEVNITGLGYTDSKVLSDFVIYDSGSVSVDENGNETPLVVHLWSFRFADFDLPAGTYFLRMYVEFFDGVTLVETKTWVTEPLDIRADWPDTIYIEATNDSNKQDVIFQYDTTDPSGWKGDIFFQPVFGYRVEGAILEYGFDSNDNYFIEQDYERRNMSPTAWRNKILQIGGRHGVPAYMFDKINHALVCDRKKIEGRRVSKDEGAKWQMSDSKVRSLYNGEIQLTDYSFKDQSTDNRGAKIVLLEEPESYPYWIYNAGFVELESLVSAGKYITSSADRDDYIDDLNTTFKDYYNLQGEFLFEDGKIKYENGPGETYTEKEATIITQYLDIDITTAAPNRNFAFNFSHEAQIGYGGVVWGDGVSYNFANSLLGGSSTKLVSRVYTSAGSYTARIFFAPLITGISILRHQHQSVINDISGDAPQGLKTFTMLCNSVDFAGLGSGLDMEFIANCRYNITSFSITYAGLTGFNGFVFSTYPATGITGDSNNWANFSSFSFYRCALTATEAEDFFKDYYDFTPLNSPVFIELRQIPIAPFTDPTALAYKTNLINAGGTVLTD